MLERSGAEVIRGQVSGFEIRDGRSVGAFVDGEYIACDVAVDAAGPYARDVALMAGTDLPLETVLRQKLVVDDRERTIPRGAPFTISLSSGLHMKPDDTVGPSAVKIGWAYDQTPVSPIDDPPLPPDFPRLALTEANRIIPDLGVDAPVVAHESGYYTRTLDGLPLIGPLKAAEGLFALAGLAGFGAMMAAAAGELLATAIVDGYISEAFLPERIQNKPASTGEL
jgi:sarcosine oxidase subunit beta